MKLIRDNIPGMPDEAWKEVDKKEAYEYLKLKLHEEVQELADSNYKDLDEFADVYETLLSLLRLAKFRPTDLEVARIIKIKSHGGFTNKVLK